MSKTTLIFDLIMYINKKKRFTAQDIADEFHVSVRTAHRYLLDLREMGIPIFSEKGRHGGFRIIKNRLLPPIIFNIDEAMAVFYAFQALKHYNTLPFNIDIQAVSRKLVQYFPDDVRKRIERLENVLMIWTQKRSVPTPLLSNIIDASLEGYIIEIEYQSKSDNTKKLIKPIGVYANDGLWYLLAYDSSRNDTRILRIDRIISMHSTHTSYTSPVKLIDWLEKPKMNEPVRLYVKLTREGMRQCRSISWMDENLTLVHEEFGYIDTFIDKEDMDYVSKFFFQLGKDATIVEPKEVVETIQFLAREILKHFQ